MPGTNPEAGLGTPEPKSLRPSLFRIFIRSIVGVSLGATIAWIDSRPDWDDTGVSAGLIALGAAFLVMIGMDVTVAIMCVAIPVAAKQPITTPGFWLIVLFALIGAGLATFAKRAIRTP